MTPDFERAGVQLFCGDCLSVLQQLPDASVNCCVTSPPYWGLRDYGHDGQIGLEETPEQYVAKLVAVFSEVHRVLRPDGTVWLNLGDSYASTGGMHDGRGDNQQGVGSKRVWRDGCGRADGIVDSRGQRNRNGNVVPGIKPKDLVGIPWRVAFAMQSAGWYLRQDIIWAKPNPMPESVTDRCTKSHEYIFLLSKSQRYFYDAESVKENSIDPESLRPDGRNPRNNYAFTQSNADSFAATRTGFAKLTGVCYPKRNRRSVWTVATQPYSEAHFATFPPKLIEPCVMAGCPVGGTVIDPFNGAGTTGLVATKLGRHYIGIELNPAYIELTKKRLEREIDQYKLPLPEITAKQETLL